DLPPGTLFSIPDSFTCPNDSLRELRGPQTLVAVRRQRFHNGLDQFGSLSLLAKQVRPGRLKFSLQKFDLPQLFPRVRFRSSQIPSQQFSCLLWTPQITLCRRLPFGLLVPASKLLQSLPAPGYLARELAPWSSRYLIRLPLHLCGFGLNAAEIHFERVDGLSQPADVFLLPANGLFEIFEPGSQLLLNLQLLVGGLTRL